MRRLLDIGANPDGEGCGVTPLQIATHFLDRRGVRMLLEAKASPNATGNGDGIAWEERTP